ncbi:MAG: polyphosphate kinase 1 [Solirubrobacteraceae bacterium]
MYINREISWLKFNARVLDEAADSTVPLLERLKFLGIYSNNLDEFYKVRYHSIQHAIDSGVNNLYNNIVENQTPEELLKEINIEINKQQGVYDKLYERLLDELGKENIHLVDEKKLTLVHKKVVNDFFENKLDQALTILTFNQGSWVKQLKDGRLYLLVKMTISKTKNRFAIIEVPTKQFPRFIELPVTNFQNYVIYLEDIIRYRLKHIFRNFSFTHIEAFAFKITRDSELLLDNDLESSLLDKISLGIKGRRKGEPVRMVFDKAMTEETLNYLKDILELDDYDGMIPGYRYLNKSDFFSFPSFGRNDLLYKKIKPIALKNAETTTSYFSLITKEDILLYTPYHDFSMLIKLLREAAIDPKVKKIGITIYRVAKDSQIMNSLVNAARNGKEVIAVLELTARFDEENNVFWSKQLQDEGIKVIFGVPNLKVHSKLIFIERENEKNKLEKFAIISTGNFNEKTANFYTDYILFTANKNITEEVNDLFIFFGSNYLLKKHKNLIVSPLETRIKLYELIDNEIKNAKKGLQSGINFKLNSLSDKGMIDKLYEASNAGVKIRLIVRGICCLVPRLKNISENIELISVIDKFLEHSRVYWFCSNNENKIYISSADLMARNIDRRVEVSTEIFNINLKKDIQTCFELSFKDNVKGRYIQNNLEEVRIKKSNSKNRSQFTIYNYLKLNNKK